MKQNKSAETVRGIKEQSGVYKFAFFCVFAFPLLPEYIAPILTVALAIVTAIFCREKIVIDKYAKLQGFYILYSIISTIWSRNPLYTLASSLLLLLMFLGQISISALADSKKSLRLFLHLLLYSATIVGGIGALQAFVSYLRYAEIVDIPLPNPLYLPLDNLVFKLLSNIGISIKTKPFLGRANSTFSNPNLYVAFLLMIFPIAVYYLLQARKRKQKLIYGTCTVVLCFGIAGSQSRGALISVGLSVLFIIFGNRRFMRKLLLVMAGFVGILSSVMQRLMRTADRLKPFSGTFLGTPFQIMVNPSTYTHLMLYFSAYEYITSNIFVFMVGVGYGVQNSWDVFRSYGIDQPHAHNLILELWLEGGLIGTVLFLTALIVLFLDLKRILRISPESRYIAVVIMASFVGLISFCIFDYVFFSPKILQCFYIFIGLASATLRLYSKAESREQSKA